MSRRRPEYALLPAESIDMDVRWRAYVAVRTACHFLEMPEPEIVWYLPSELVPYKAELITPNVRDADGTPIDVRGWVSSDEPDRIYLRADFPASFMQTALHECRHLWQYARRSQFRSKASREADADEWAAKAMRYAIPPTLRF